MALLDMIQFQGLLKRGYSEVVSQETGSSMFRYLLALTFELLLNKLLDLSFACLSFSNSALVGQPLFL